ncbi:lipase family protein [Nocardia bovistercoris]|uniref:Lipase n=1 Tax=Nocardia bovistercoris TaxID=2785916 RepID=A0A931I7A8_9NOCA|nr:lipase family protein [Nocardia bovistercoris]MBH0775571.1 lipase [Nocardia bovistercoris]
MAAEQTVSTGRAQRKLPPKTGIQQIFRISSVDSLRALRRLAAAAISAAALCLTNAAPATAAPIYPIPESDAFYWAPPDLANFRSGDVLRSRAMPTAVYPGATAWQLLYRTTDSQNAPIAAVTTVFVPSGGGDNRPLVSYQPFVNSLGTRCAPSHTLFNGGLQEGPALNVLLARGWALAVPDHLGPTSAYGAARLGGRITLDGIRAAKRFEPAGLAGSPVGLAGYSGGGMATGFAAALAPEYAPELPIVGAAQGGVPVNIGKLALEVGGTPNPLFGLGFAAAMGLEREYPNELVMDRILNTGGSELRARIANACTDEIIAAGANRSFGDVFTTGMDADETTVRILHENSLETFPGVPRAPIYQWHGAADQVSPVLVREVSGRYCAAGTPVLLDMIPGADHASAMLQGIPRAFDYLADRFAGVPAPTNC